MYQYRRFANKISMEILNLKVINLDRRFKNFVLNPFNSYKLTIGKYKYIAGFKTSCQCPAKLVNIERMTWCCRYSFTIYTNASIIN